jgi:MinD-like ATPase involved in chromosome partitioning or flagellar assembly
LRTVKLASKKGIPLKGMVVNKVISSRNDMSIRELEELWGNSVISEIPFDKAISEGFSNQQPAILSGKDIKSKDSLAKLASALTGETLPKAPSLIEIIMKFIKRR